MPLSTTSAEKYVALTKVRALSDLAFQRFFVPPAREAYFLEYARSVKKVVKIPVILVGGIRKVETMEKIVKDGEADFLSMARPFIREPDLVKQIQNGRRGFVDCTSCNLCLNIGVFELRCWRKKKTRLLKALYYELRKPNPK
jgi:2,4-dienoyl-CoA reductase-like NADH-dependent reductase (Old Yellow Enzyme family)